MVVIAIILIKFELFPNYTIENCIKPDTMTTAGRKARQLTRSAAARAGTPDSRLTTITIGP